MNVNCNGEKGIEVNKKKKGNVVVREKNEVGR